jgi:hypothetical protein
MKEASSPSSPRLRRLRRRHIVLWLLFFLVVGLVIVLTLFSWRRFLPPSQVVLVLLSRAPSERVVRNETEKRMAECDVWYVFGVDKVINQLTVADGSQRQE